MNYIEVKDYLKNLPKYIPEGITPDENLHNLEAMRKGPAGNFAVLPSNSPSKNLDPSK